MSSRQIAVLATLILYKAVLLGIGLFAQKRTKSEDDFYLGGRRLGPLVAAVSAAASSSSVWTLLGISGFAYGFGLSAVWLFPACVGGFIINWYWLAPALRAYSHRTQAVTITEILAGPPGRPLRRTLVIVASIIVLFSLGAYVSSQFRGAGKTFEDSFDMDPVTSILVGAAVVVIYTMLGGFWAVSLTDTLQGLMMALTAVLLPTAALIQVGGPSGLWEGLQRVAQPDYLSFTKHAQTTGGIGFVLGLLGIGLGYPGQPHAVNRFMALEAKESSLRRARRIAMAWSVVVYGGMILLGWCGRLIVDLDPSDSAQRERVFMETTHALFSPVVAGIMVAAVLSAIMSTADSQLLVAASAVTHDLGLGGRAPESTVRNSRIVVLVLSLAAVLVALVVTESLFKNVLLGWSAMGAAFGPLLMKIVLSGPVPPLRSLSAMCLGFGLSVLAYANAFGSTRGTWWERVLPIVVAAAIVLWPTPQSRV